MLNDIATTILYLSASGSLVVLVLLLLKPFIQSRLSKKWYYYVWLIVIVRLIVPYGLPIHVISHMVNPKTDYSAANENNMAADSPLPAVINENIDFKSPQQIITPIIEGIETDVIEPIAGPVQKDFFDYFQTLPPFLGLIWLSIGLTLFAKKLLLYFHFVSCVKSGSKPIYDEAVLEICGDTCRSLGIKKKLPVFIHQTVGSPMLIGLLKPMIVLPEKQMENSSHLKYVFMHELTHYKRFDIFYKWLLQIVLCVHWFNPVTYLVGKEVNISCELSCDEAVIKKLTFQEQRAYGDALLRSLELLGHYSNSAVSLTLAENSKLMKERLKSIMKFHKKSKLTTCISAFLAFILCTGTAFTGVQAETISNNKEVIVSNKINSSAKINSSTVMTKDLQNLQPIPNTMIGARAYSGEWASATGIEADTYKKQIDEKIKWVENLYNEKKERFMLNETISEKEITNTLGIQYMYEKSSVYRDMANVGNTLQSSPAANIGGTFRFLPYDSSFSRTGSKKYYERSVFYVDQSAMMNLSLSYDLTEGKLGFMVISPEGKAVCSGDPLSHYSNTITFPVNKGLWSLVTVNESETGAIKGTQKIEGTIASAENFIVPIDIAELKANETTSYGPYYLSEKQALSVDIESWKGIGNLFVADMKEGNAFNHSVVIQKAPDGFAFLADESRYYYITIGNSSDVTLTDIKGKLTLNLKGIYQSPKNKDESKTLSNNNAAKVTKQNDAVTAGQSTKISVDIPSVSGNGFVKSYGKYYLSKDDTVYADITWKGSGYVMFLYTKENLSTDDIAALIDKGVLPLGGGGKFLGAGTEITSNFTYQSQKKGIVYNLATSADEIRKTMRVPSEGDYYFYVIAKSNTEITDINGDIILGQKTVGAYKIGEKLPNMNVWIGSAGENETSTGAIFNARNYTGDKINYKFLSEENGSKTFKFNSSLTGEYEIVFVTSDRTIIKTIPPFTGNKEVTVKGLPKDTISLIVRSNNVSGSLSMDIESTATKNKNIAIDIKNKNTYNISESGSFQGEDGQILRLIIVSGIKGGTVDLFLFDPNGKEQKITIGSSITTKEIKLTKGVWAYNCSGIFKDGGNIQVTGIIE